MTGYMVRMRWVESSTYNQPEYIRRHLMYDHGFIDPGELNIFGMTPEEFEATPDYKLMKLHRGIEHDQDHDHPAGAAPRTYM